MLEPANEGYQPITRSYLSPSSTLIEMSTLEGVNGTTCDAQQYQQGLLSLKSLNPSITCLTHGQSIGLAVGTQFLCLKFCFLIHHI
jgi:hypothetical protein